MQSQKLSIDNLHIPASEDQYRLLVESVKDYAIFMLDIYGNILTWNAGAQKIKGYIPSEIIGKHFSIFYQKEDIDRGYPELELKTAREKGIFEDEGWRLRKDKTLFWANVVITPIYDRDNQLIGFSKITRDLSNRKKTEQEFINSQKQYKLLIEGVNSIKDYAIIILDENGYVTNWNEGAERINGYSGKEIISHHFSTFYPKDAVEAGYPAFELEKAVADGRYEDEGWRVRKDESLYWANVIITPIYQGKKLAGFSKVVQDLTEKKQREESLTDVEDKYRLLINSIEDYAIFMLDTAGYVTSWSIGAEKIKGYTSDEIIGKHFSKFYPKKSVETGFPEMELREAAKNGRYEDQGWRIKKDGSLFWANVVISAIYKNSKLIGYSKITRDLTEWKKAERILKESEERYRLLVNGIKDYAIFMLDPYGYVATWNTGAERIKGYRPEEVIGKHFSIFYDEDAVASGFPEYELNRAKETGRFEHEGWRVKKDGSKFWASVILATITNKDGNIVGFSKVTRDLTEVKKSESDLVKKNAELNRVNADLDNFIYTASHDLKAPISNIEGLLNVLAESMKEKEICDDSLDGILAMMDKSVQRFRKTIYDLTEITKTQRSVLEEVTEINIEEVLEDVKDSIGELISSSHAVIREKLKNCNTIRSTKSNFRAILYNLISNAIKYKHPDRKPVVEVKCEKLKNYYLLEVSDNGLGIPPEYKDKIFSMFKRLHDHVEGTGIGLFLVKRIVDNLEGRIEVESEVNKGTTFKIFFKRLDI